MKMTKTLIPFLLIPLISFLTSCAGLMPPPVYSGPKKGSIADIKFLGHASYPEKTLYFFKNSQNCTGVEDGTSQIQANGSSLKIPANKDFTFSLDFGDFISSCGFVISFKPLPKTTYIVFYKLDYSECKLGIAKFSNGKLTPIQIRKRIPHMPWDYTGNFCEPESSASK